MMFNNQFVRQDWILQSRIGVTLQKMMTRLAHSFSSYTSLWVPVSFQSFGNCWMANVLQVPIHVHQRDPALY